MAIDTTNKKIAAMELDALLEPGMPISPGSIDQGDKQQFLWGYPGVLWGAFAGVSVAGFPFNRLIIGSPEISRIINVRQRLGRIVIFKG